METSGYTLTMEQYLRRNFEDAMPSWIAGVGPGKSRVVSFLRKFLESRIVYYPGSGTNWDPLDMFSRSGAAHCFIYADYGLSRADVEVQLRHGVGGYQLLMTLDVGLASLSPGYPWNLTRRHKNGSSAYGLLAVLEQEEDRSSRISVLFIAADGYDAFEAIFCRTSPPIVPFCVVLQDCGFGGNHDRYGFGGGSRLERQSSRASNLPPLLLVGDNTTPWAGYRESSAAPRAMGMHENNRRLYIRESGDQGF